ncbi:histidinol-phosphate transaminase [Pyrofollis japonicus]|uniref:histidinol-phosphate transaminase n=1 Tax=Pyrofollis japonicus TaxID=3060460 RepID=UPI00295B747F|nr:histidinol-phosphate transaminase [Pyrofollis japonicus]BEP17963.1 histidinol-phosphate transaminase [Pyrofollis japonicus]
MVSTVMIIRKWVREAPVYEPRDYSRDTVARLDLNENPEPPPQCIVDAILEEARRANRYPEKNMYNQLLDGLSEYTGISRDNIAFGPGSDALLRSLFEAVLDPGDVVVAAAPSFSMYRVYSSLSGARYRETPLRECGDKWCVDRDAFLEEAKNAKLVVIDNPNNPTGSLLFDRETIASIAENTRGLVVVDEAYYEFSKETVIDLVSEFSNIVVTRTFSKAFGLAGLRIGYLVAAKDVRDAVWKFLAPFPMPRTSIAAAIAALGCRNIFKKIVENIAERREWLREHLGALGMKPYRSWTNFVLVDTRIDNVVDRLAERGVMVRRVPFGDTWARITIGARGELEILLKTLSEIKG